MLNKRKLKTLGEALVLALEAEIVFRKSGSQDYVRKIGVVERLTDEKVDLADVVVKAYEKATDKLINRLSEVLTTSLGDNQRRSIGKGRGRPKCWNCGKIGHLQRDCRDNRYRRFFRSETGTSWRGAPVEHSDRQQYVDDIDSDRCASTAEGGCLTIDGTFGKKRCVLTVDTGSARSIIRPDVLGNASMHRDSQCKLKTATGSNIPVLGEAVMDLQIDQSTFQHRFIVAEIVDDCIIGMDFMEKYDFQFDFRQKMLKIGMEQTPLFVEMESSSVLRIPVTTGVTVPDESPLADSNIQQLNISEPTESESCVWNEIDSLLGLSFLHECKNLKSGMDDSIPNGNLYLKSSDDVYEAVEKTSNDKVKLRCEHQSVTELTEDCLARLYNLQPRRARSFKMQPGWKSPYKVIKKINDVVYRIQRSPRAKMKVVHVDRLTRYHVPAGEGLNSIRDE